MNHRQASRVAGANLGSRLAVVLFSGVSIGWTRMRWPFGMYQGVPCGSILIWLNFEHVRHIMYVHHDSCLTPMNPINIHLPLSQRSRCHFVALWFCVKFLYPSRSTGPSSCSPSVCGQLELPFFRRNVVIHWVISTDSSPNLCGRWTLGRERWEAIRNIAQMHKLNKHIWLVVGPPL